MLVGLPMKSLFKSPQPPLSKGEEEAGVSPPLEKGAGGVGDPQQDGAARHNPFYSQCWTTPSSFSVQARPFK